MLARMVKGKSWLKAGRVGLDFMMPKLETAAHRYSRWDVLVVAGACLVAGASLSAAWLMRPKNIDAAFHRMHYEAAFRTNWLGVQVIKNPMDMWVFQELIHDTKPDVLIETGTYRGGSAYYFASIFDLIGNGRVYTMDIEDIPGKPRHARINFRKDSSTSKATLTWLRSEIRPGERVMVTLDSLHTKEHVLAELDRYAPLVTPGCYLVVEDTHVRHPIDVSGDETLRGHEGPFEAVQEWLPRHPEFERDLGREKFGMTFNPGGWLRKRR